MQGESEIISSWKPARTQFVTKEMRERKGQQEKEGQQDERQTAERETVEDAARTMAMSQTVYCMYMHTTLTRRQAKPLAFEQLQSIGFRA